MAGEVPCLRCGACCHYEFDGKIKKCKHLVKISRNKTLCRIWNKPDRAWRVIAESKKTGVKILCGERIKQKKHYPNCPFNKLIKLEEK